MSYSKGIVLRSFELCGTALAKYCTVNRGSGKEKCRFVMRMYCVVQCCYGKVSCGSVSHSISLVEHSAAVQCNGMVWLGGVW